MNQPSPDERELVLSALRDIAGLLDAGKCSEVIALYNTVPSRATAHERRLVSHAAAYAEIGRAHV